MFLSMKVLGEDFDEHSFGDDERCPLLFKVDSSDDVFWREEVRSRAQALII